jgi:hypothetical protein
VRRQMAEVGPSTRVTARLIAASRLDLPLVEMVGRVTSESLPEQGVLGYRPTRPRGSRKDLHAVASGQTVEHSSQ